MPSFRRVSFSEQNHYSRLPHEDELYVMKAFAKHADGCDSCYDPYQAYKDGSTLCPRGHQRALDVAQYVYTKGGNSYSQVDRERNQRVQIEVPANCEAVRQLLKAMERGLRLMRKGPPPTSYDRTYYVPARLSVPDNTRSMPQTRPSTSSSSSTSRRPSSNKSVHPETLTQLPIRPRSRSRVGVASSVSSTGGASSSRSSRPCFVRPRSRSGSRAHSPIFIRPGSSTATATSNRSRPDTRESRESNQHLHSRNNSASSVNSRASSVFSRGSSRNSSVSSIESERGGAGRDREREREREKQRPEDYYRKTVPVPVLTSPPAGKVAFRESLFEEGKQQPQQKPGYRTIVPGMQSPPVSPVSPGRERRGRRHS